jgi:hypothetical protein
MVRPVKCCQFPGSSDAPALRGCLGRIWVVGAVEGDGSLSGPVKGTTGGVLEGGDVLMAPGATEIIKTCLAWDTQVAAWVICCVRTSRPVEDLEVTQAVCAGAQIVRLAKAAELSKAIDAAMWEVDKAEQVAGGIGPRGAVGVRGYWGLSGWLRLARQPALAVMVN